MPDKSLANEYLNCASTMFAQPGVPYMHKLRAVNHAAVVSVSGLPEGLSWNERRRLVEGTVASEGVYSYTALVSVDGKTVEIPVTLTVSSDLQQPLPFMGWLSWNVVQNEISEDVVRTVADAMVSTGLRDAGYNYLVMDDLWHAEKRDSVSGRPVADPVKFPNGIRACADYVHDKGLKFGIYSDAAEKTCASAYGSLGYEEIDAATYADWAVDLLKYDYCFAPESADTAYVRYKKMGDALKATGRPILYYMCEWGTRSPWLWGEGTGASCWRATLDTRDGWQGKDGGIGMEESVAGMKHLWPYHGMNRFNDADMLCVGIHGKGKASSDLVVKAGMTPDEYATQFALWCMWGSPLSLSFDLREPVSPEDLALLTNAELIAIDQDVLCQAAEFIGEDDRRVQLYAKDLAGGDVAVAVVNMGDEPAEYVVDFSRIDALDPSATYNVRDLMQRCDLPIAKGAVDMGVIAPHQTKVIRLNNSNNL